MGIEIGIVVVGGGVVAIDGDDEVAMAVVGEGGVENHTMPAGGIEVEAAMIDADKGAVELEGVEDRVGGVAEIDVAVVECRSAGRSGAETEAGDLVESDEVGAVDERLGIGVVVIAKAWSPVGGIGSKVGRVVVEVIILCGAGRGDEIDHFAIVAVVGSRAESTYHTLVFGKAAEAGEGDAVGGSGVVGPRERTHTAVTDMIAGSGAHPGECGRAIGHAVDHEVGGTEAGGGGMDTDVVNFDTFATCDALEANLIESLVARVRKGDEMLRPSGDLGGEGVNHCPIARGAGTIIDVETALMTALDLGMPEGELGTAVEGGKVEGGQYEHCFVDPAGVIKLTHIAAAIGACGIGSGGGDLPVGGAGDAFLVHAAVKSLLEIDLVGGEVVYREGVAEGAENGELDPFALVVGAVGTYPSVILGGSGKAAEGGRGGGNLDGVGGIGDIVGGAVDDGVVAGIVGVGEGEEHGRGGGIAGTGVPRSNARVEVLHKNIVKIIGIAAITRADGDVATSACVAVKVGLAELPFTVVGGEGEGGDKLEGGGVGRIGQDAHIGTVGTVSGVVAHHIERKGEGVDTGSHFGKNDHAAIGRAGVTAGSHIETAGTGVMVVGIGVGIVATGIVVAG